MQKEKNSIDEKREEKARMSITNIMNGSEKDNGWRWCNAHKDMLDRSKEDKLSIKDKLDILNSIVQNAEGRIIAPGIDDEKFSVLILKYAEYMQNFLRKHTRQADSIHETLEGICYYQTCYAKEITGEEGKDMLVIALLSGWADVMIGYFEIANHYYDWYDDDKMFSQKEQTKLKGIPVDVESHLTNLAKIDRQLEYSKCKDTLLSGKNKLILQARHYVRLIETNDRNERYDVNE